MFLKRGAYPEWVSFIIGLMDILEGLVYALSFGHISIGLIFWNIQNFGWISKFYRNGE